MSTVYKVKGTNVEVGITKYGGKDRGLVTELDQIALYLRDDTPVVGDNGTYAKTVGELKNGGK